MIIKNVFLILKKTLIFYSFIGCFTLASLLFPSFAHADCIPIMQTPSIYQINRTASQAVLYIQPVTDQVDSYTILYGFQSGDERYGVTFDYGQSSGAIPYTINSLDSSKHYYFKIRANNSCSNSNWSAWAGDTKFVTTGSSSAASSTSGQVNKLPATGSNSVMIGLGIGLITMVSGFALFAL